MNRSQSVKGPWLQRVAVVLCSILTGILFLWLQGFVVTDIGDLPGPRYSRVEKSVLEPNLVRQSKALAASLSEVDAQIRAQQSRQELLRDSTSSSQQTMRQLLEMQRLSIQRNAPLFAAEREALAQSESLFLANQARYQRLNEDIATLNEKRRAVQDEINRIDARLNKQRMTARKQFNRLQHSHDLKVASLQLLFLIPLLALAVYLFLKRRASMYGPIVYAFGCATLIMATVVVHRHFPTRLFKYVLLMVFLVVVVRVLVHLIRALTFPKFDSLLKQYREAYERFLCPVCEYPIRRGPMKYRFWDRRTIRKAVHQEPVGRVADTPYVCPACGTSLYESCSACGAMRHTLLPFCEVCGHEKGIPATVS